MAYYLSKINVGLDKVASLGDGTSMNLLWFKAFPDGLNNRIAYNLYYSTNRDTVFSEGPKFVVVDNALDANLIDFTPGQMYWFGLRPIETVLNLGSLLPIAYDNIRFYPTTMLASNISDSDLIIPVLDTEGFPSSGLIKVGVELIQYSNIVGNSFILNNIDQRGYGTTFARFHNTDGYDGVRIQNTIIPYYVEGESLQYDRVYMCQSRFEYPNFSFLITDGYHQEPKDLLTSDLTASDEENVDFPMYDYAGYHRTDPTLLFAGECVGSYIGGEKGCIDGYGNVNRTRGLNVQDTNNQREEILLTLTGRPVVLLQLQRTGITCSCYMPSSEYQDERCVFCFGTKFVMGYNQYFNPRRSDGRILVRPGPTDENVKMYEAGLESEFPLDLWTLTVPTIKSRDILIFYDIDGNEDFRYEVMNVTRNNTLLGQQGGQKLKCARIRKTDIAYQIKAFKDTSTMPMQINTSIGFAPGIVPHTHTLVRNETDPSNWQQLTSSSQGHNHEVRMVDGILTVIPALGHSHSLFY